MLERPGVEVAGGVGERGRLLEVRRGAGDRESCHQGRTVNLQLVILGVRLQLCWSSPFWAPFLNCVHLYYIRTILLLAQFFTHEPNMSVFKILLG